MPQEKTQTDWKAYRAEKALRWAEFEEVLERALEAGDAAARRTRPDRHRMGTVWLRLDDGRTSFAWFMRSRHKDIYRRGPRRQGNYIPADYGDFRQALAWAEAAGRVLAAAGIKVTVMRELIQQ